MPLLSVKPLLQHADVDLTHRVEVRSADEVGQMTEALNVTSATHATSKRWICCFPSTIQAFRYLSGKISGNLVVLAGTNFLEGYALLEFKGNLMRGRVDGAGNKQGILRGKLRGFGRFLESKASGPLRKSAPRR